MHPQAPLHRSLLRWSLESFLFFPSIHPVHVLHGLSGGAFEKVIEAGDEHETPAVLRQTKSEIAIVRAQRKLHLRKLRCRKRPDPTPARIEITAERLHFARSRFAAEVQVGRAQERPLDA